MNRLNRDVRFAPKSGHCHVFMSTRPKAQNDARAAVRSGSKKSREEASSMFAFG
jgi:hypothetical protein